MKNLLILITIMLASACASTIPTMKSVVGEYENKGEDGITHKHVYLDNGVFEEYVNDKKRHVAGWKIVDGKIHTHHSGRLFWVYRINPDKSLTHIGIINNEKWTHYPNPPIYKKIK